jgi:hypothetical protein
MSIQFCHVRKFIPRFDLERYSYLSELDAKGGETIAMEEVPAWLLDKVETGDFFTKKIGKAKCSDKENYNRKVGRELAESRMKPVVLTVISNQDFHGVRILILIDDQSNLYELQKKLGHDKVRFIGYNNG